MLTQVTSNAHGSPSADNPPMWTADLKKSLVLDSARPMAITSRTARTSMNSSCGCNRGPRSTQMTSLTSDPLTPTRGQRCQGHHRTPCLHAWVLAFALGFLPALGSAFAADLGRPRFLPLPLAGVAASASIASNASSASSSSCCCS